MSDLPTLRQPSLPAAPADPWATLFDPAGFEQYKALADTISRAQLLCPQHLRQNPSDLLLVLAMAHASGVNPITMMQNTYVISGKLGWNAQFLVARANASGRFRGPINWRVEGEGPSLVVTAYATLAATGAEATATASMAMAVAEGWTKRNGKYATMGELMLRWRSATMLVRLFCPDVLMGLSEREELVDVGPDLRVVEPAPPSRVLVEPSPAAAPTQPRAVVIDATYEPVAAPDPSVDKPPPAPPLGAPPQTPATPSVAVAPAQAAGPVDAAEHQRLANAAQRSLDALTADGKRRVREAAGVPHGKRLSEQPDAVLAAIPALAQAEAERERARKAAHHPSWSADGPRFHAELSGLGTNYDDVAAFCERKGAKRPSAMDDTGRDRLLGRLRDPAVRAEMGLPALEAMPADEAPEPGSDEDVDNEDADEESV